jgi:VIT1/CCC1 family predicted Fe2+/Mn2+ transporter
VTSTSTSLWHRVVVRVRETTWALDANDGIVAIAGILQGFTSAGAGDRLLLLAASTATLAGALSAGGTKWAEVAAQRETELAIAREQAKELAADPAGEHAELVDYWEGRGLTPEMAREVADQLVARDPLGAHLDAEFGLEEITARREPWVAGVQTTLAFTIGAAVPLLITYFVPLSIESTLIVVAVVVSLTLTSFVAAGVGRLSAVRMLIRSLVVGLGTMGVSYLAGMAFF